MKNFLLATSLLFVLPLQAKLEDHFRPVPKTAVEHQLKNIDYIYLINLDQRPEKLEKSLQQLGMHGIYPQRFSAIYGWHLPPEVMQDISLVYEEGMLCDQWATYYPLGKSLEPAYDFLREDCIGKPYFCYWMSPGAVGCALSHLSILQDAYDSGYETIWVMEDDIFIHGDPLRLPGLIEKLDDLVGKDNWDILYTDSETLLGAPFEEDLPFEHWWMWRPDIPIEDLSVYNKREKVSEDFVKIISRWRTHSMIIRRSGIKKILDYLKACKIYNPLDHEICLTPGINLYMLRYNLVTMQETVTDNWLKNFE